MLRHVLLVSAVVLVLLTSAAPAQPADGAAGDSPAPPADLRQSVVKIFATTRPPDPARPWSKRQPAEVSGTGWVIPGNRILTNAHVVSYATQILVQPYESSDKLPAKVVAQAAGIDLAVIELEDPAFFEEHPPLAMAEELPKVADKVSVLGFPMGGTAMSTTEGIVSRIEYATYYHGVLGLRLQVDAALNPGNSGGPAFVDNRVVGVVFSGMQDAQNIGYLIPVEEVRAFLDDIADGRYEGRAQLFDSMQTLENPALRAKLGLDAKTTGLMVTHPGDDDPEYPLKAWDVVDKIGDYDIDNAGMVPAGPNLRLRFGYLVPKLTTDGTVPLSIIRGGERLTVEVPASATSDDLLRWLDDAYPSYFVYGPLVFTPVYADHLEWYDRALEYLAERQSPIITRMKDDAAFEGEQMVMLATPLLPHRIGKGYDAGFFAVLDTVNGTKIKNLRHLVETLSGLEDEFVTLTWADQATETLVFRRADLAAATEEILEDNGIRSPASEDVRDAWTGE